MNALFKIWVEIALLVAGVTVIKGAITGKFYSAARGANPTRRPLAQVKSAPARFAFAIIGLGILVWFFLRLFR
jgi:hypothetical protein